MTRLILILGFLKVGGALAASLLIDAPFPRAGGPYAVPPALDFLLTITYSLVAGVLLALGRTDARAVSFGGCLLMVATAFTTRPVAHLVAAGGGALQDFAAVLDSLKLDIFIPFFLWRFIRDFPRVPMPPGLKLFMEAGIRVSAAVGVLFSGLGFVRALWIAEKGEPGVPAAIAFFAPKTGEGIYYMLMMALVGIALVPLAWKARKSAGDERRRVRLLTASLLLGLGPAAIEVLCEGGLIPGYSDWMKIRPTARGWLVFLLLGVGGLSIPLTTAYSVLVYRALELKLIARRALQYTLAKSSVLVLAAVPAASLLLYLYVNRSYSVSELFSGARVLLLLSGVAIGAVTLRYRKMLLDVIDRRFFREQYDARQILTLLVERIRSINESASLANLVSREIDLALHLEGVAMMVLDPRSGMLSDPRSRARRLDASSSLALLISNASDPLEVDLESPQSPLARLDEKERHWLVDSNFRLIVPILGRDGSLLGMVGLGEKKSGLPFLKEDRQLLHAIASSAAWVLELEMRWLPPPPSSWDTAPPEDSHSSELPTPAAEYAKECATCGTLYQSFTVFCGHCSRRLDVSRVPFVLPGKFRFERRIGAGGMGLVYRGSDMALGRHVAIKTLRRVSPEDAMRLRREARTAAAVSHPHLAPVYGMETWQGTPMLIMELLEGGTLTQRVEREKRLSPAETVELGIAMTEALAHLHAADILHRDIKPSNIGYTRDGTPKLMDFGIARMMMLDLRPEEDAALLSGLEDDSVLLPPTSIWGQGPGSSILSQRQLAGTLSYLSPEALHGEPPDASFDLWSLAIVLYECLLGRKVFTGGESRQLMMRIKNGRVPELAQVLPEYEGPLGDFFRNALHKNRARRPASAREMRHQLVALRPRLPPPVPPGSAGILAGPTN